PRPQSSSRAPGDSDQVSIGPPSSFGIVAAAATTGNAEIIAGGDPRYVRLSDAREQLKESLALIRGRIDLDSLCTPRRCTPDQDATLCQLLRSLSSEEQKSCRAFLDEKSPELERLSTGTQTPFVLSALPLQVGSGNTSRRVIAVTTRGPGGPVVLHFPSIS